MIIRSQDYCQDAYKAFEQLQFKKAAFWRYSVSLLALRS